MSDSTRDPNRRRRQGSDENNSSGSDNVFRRCDVCEGGDDVRDGGSPYNPCWLNGPVCLNCFLLEHQQLKKKPIRVLSLFDGIGAALLALETLGLEVEEYFSCEIDDDAIGVLNFNFHGRITHLGCVESLTIPKLESLGPIDLLLGGSLSSQLSLANPGRKGLYDPLESEVLFFQFNRVLKFLQASAASSGNTLFWLCGNVTAMPDDFKNTISRTLQCDPALWDAIQSLPAKRAHLFWGNIPDLHQVQCEDNAPPCLEQILEPCRKAFVACLPTLTATQFPGRTGNQMLWPMMRDVEETDLRITERERLYGFPSHYTDGPDLAISTRHALLGRAWSVPVIKKILSPLSKVFQLKNK